MRSGARPRLNNTTHPGIIFSQVCPDLVTGIKNNAVSAGKNSTKEATINLRVAYCAFGSHRAAGSVGALSVPPKSSFYYQHRERRHGSIRYGVTATKDQHG